MGRQAAGRTSAVPLRRAIGRAAVSASVQADGVPVPETASASVQVRSPTGGGL